MTNHDASLSYTALDIRINPMKLALFVAAAILAPLLLLRGAALIRYFARATFLWTLFAIVTIVVRRRELDFDLRVAAITCGVLTVALLWRIVATARPMNVQWSASRAAAAVALFYIAAIPLMMWTPPDGDESFYLLITESIVHDGDVDIGNQLRDLAHSVTRRTDLKPQLGDVVGRHGEVISHLEPFLSLLLVPGYVVAKLPGVLITMALFGALLARSTIRLFEEEGVPDPTMRAVFPLFALGPPIVFYATRVWPEVPAALFFVEAIRGLRARRAKRWMPALLALVLLKLRFILVAVVLLARGVRRPRQLAIAALILVIPLSIAWMLSGSATSVHSVAELVPTGGTAMLRGLFGLLLDGQAGIALQAPIYLFALIALRRWGSTPSAFRLGMTSSALYIFSLIPRAEWHGGWSPPLRYIVIFMPILALGFAAVWERLHARPVAIATAWTIGLVAHGMAFSLFHIVNGECSAGEALSRIFHTDFSRLFPSYVRLNYAAYVAAIVFLVGLALFRTGRMLSPLVVTLLLAAFFIAGRKPGNRVEFEDAHVMHRGGELYPYVWQVQRFLYRGGWVLRAGDSMSFLAKRGTSLLQYQAAGPATLQLGTRAYVLAPTGQAYGTARVAIDRGGRVELRCLSGAVNLDRMDRE